MKTGVRAYLRTRLSHTKCMHSNEVAMTEMAQDSVLYCSFTAEDHCLYRTECVAVNVLPNLLYLLLLCRLLNVLYPHHMHSQAATGKGVLSRS